MPLNNKSWLEISKDSLKQNLSVFKKLVGKNTKVACVVKANAYGHGAKEVVRVLRRRTDWFAVDSLTEALEIKKMGLRKNILVLGYIPEPYLRETILADISFVVYEITDLKKIVSYRLDKKAKIHLKVETGLNRQGVKGNELIRLAKFAKKNEQYFLIEGAYTHYADIEDTLDSTFAMLQLKRFKNELSLLKKEGISIPFKHSTASAGAILYPNTRFNMIRLGISLYRLWPSKETRVATKIKGKRVLLKPVLSWKATVAQVKKLAVGESVGYGRTWFSPRISKIAILPVGYYDGYDRGLSNNSHVLIRGKRVPVVGRIAMNMIMVDVTAIKNAKVGDEAVLIGKSGKEEITADELANKLGTINYEIVSRINPYIPRIIV